MDDDVTYVTWVMCDVCYRAFKDFDKLVAHKESAHSSLQSSSNEVNSRKSQRKRVNENPSNGEKRKSGRPRKTETVVKGKRIKAEEKKPKAESLLNLKAPSSTPSTTVKTTKSSSSSSATQSRSPSTSPKSTKIKNCNRLLAVFHNPKSFISKNNRQKNKSIGPLSKKSTSSNANKSSQGEKTRCPQCFCDLESKSALKMHMGLHNAILIIPNSSNNRKSEILSSSSSTASSTVSSKSNNKPNESLLVKAKPIQCKKCHKMLIEPPYNCINCIGSKIVFDIPTKSSNVLVKQEPCETSVSTIDDSTKDMDTQNRLYINNNNNVSKKNKNLAVRITIKDSPQLDESQRIVMQNQDEKEGKQEQADESDDDVQPIEVISTKKFAQIEVIDVN